MVAVLVVLAAVLPYTIGSQARYRAANSLFPLTLLFCE